MADILARGMAATAQVTADDVAAAVAALPKGLVYKGAVNTYADLPASASTGDTYTVKADEFEYAWGKYEGVNQWIKIGADYDEEIAALQSGKQDVISDLSTIRSGAALGATALQSHQSLDAYRTSAAQDVIDAGKQATLTAGTNITIVDNVISATGGGSSLSADGTTIKNNSGVLSTDIGGYKTVATPSQSVYENSGSYTDNSFIAFSTNWTKYPTGSIGNYWNNKNCIIKMTLTQNDTPVNFSFNKLIASTGSGWVGCEITGVEGFPNCDIYMSTSGKTFQISAKSGVSFAGITFSNIQLWDEDIYTFNTIDSHYIDIDGSLKYVGTKLGSNLSHIKDADAYGAQSTQSVNSSNKGFALGNGCLATDDSSLAVGYQTQAKAQGAFAAGQNALANSVSSIALGDYTQAKSYAQTAIGKYNKADTASTYAFIIGNGTANAAANRANAMVVDWNGNAKIAGDIIVGCDASSGNGLAIARIPNCPSSNDGTYVLKCTVSQGSLDYQWVSDGPAPSGDVYNLIGVQDAQNYTVTFSGSDWNAEAFANVTSSPANEFQFAYLDSEGQPVDQQGAVYGSFVDNVLTVTGGGPLQNWNFTVTLSGSNIVAHSLDENWWNMSLSNAVALQLTVVTAN